MTCDACLGCILRIHRNDASCQRKARTLDCQTCKQLDFFPSQAPTPAACLLELPDGLRGFMAIGRNADCEIVCLSLNVRSQHVKCFSIFMHWKGGNQAISGRCFRVVCTSFVLSSTDAITQAATVKFAGRHCVLHCRRSDPEAPVVEDLSTLQPRLFLSRCNK